MKKQAIVLLAAGISFSSLSPMEANLIHAEESNSKVEQQNEAVKRQVPKQQALKVAENFFNVTFKSPNYRYDQKWFRTETPVWNISYEEKTEEGNTSTRYNITIDAVNGNIMETRYNRVPIEDQSFSYPPKVNWKEGQTKAHTTVLKYFQDIVKQVKFDKSNQPTKPSLSDRVTYTYQYNRIVDGAPLQDNYIRVRVNGNNELVSFSSRWNPNIDIEEQNVEVTSEDALKKFEEKLPVSMQYNTLNRYYRPSSDESNEMVLEYDLNEAYPYLDATSGEWLNRKGDIANQEEKVQRESITDQPLEPIRMIKSIMKEPEAKDLTQKLVNIPENMSLDNVEYHQNEHQPTSWEFTYIDPNQDGKEYEKKRIHVRINATTGEIYSYNLNDRSLYEDLDSKKVNLTYEDAQKKAIDYVKKFAPSKAHKVYLQSNPNENEINEDVKERKQYSFIFQRQEKDIPVVSNSIRVTLSAVNGELVRFYQDWESNVSFPSPENVISKEEAFQRFLERFDIQLGWKQLQENNDEKQNNKQEAYRKVYYLNNLNIFDQSVYLNAKTGEWHSNSDGEVVKVNQEAKDIEGLPQENALKLMISYGAIPVDAEGNVHPNEPITRGEMVKMLMLANNPDPVYYQNMADKYSAEEASFKDVGANSQYFSFVEEAIREGYLDKEDESFKPDELVTRLELAKLIVHALEYDELAGHSDMFKHPFKDISTDEAKGYVSIVHYLDIMSTNQDHDEFKPKQNIDRAHAAQVFFQYLKARSSLD
ncbi:S-layer homology domain-containing protein [Pontibacillus marinus]|uniref:SLH domain-containing protein n=1 Tax=Pontibacillus marinus BH030004 = DSM 16465 TaxID=1385511 RepID=A0A0A5G0B1_9BACI|nr:S-layer homology domain-containing protein [Pontibacillus marinus]KGX84518.1 hypothetical protein N783_17270 [Pontibacillus marinus BH030004 = DSM 16465]